MQKGGHNTMANQELTTHEKQELKQGEQTRPGRTFVPDVDIYETPDSLWLWADMPGIDENSLEVNVADGVLAIEGQVALQDYDNLAPVYTEYNIGNYARRFTLSNEIDSERIKARMNNGVLELELPKAERAKPRRITVSAS
jgi:HSP20 family protein